MNPQGPYYDNQQWPASGGIRIPNELFGSGAPGNPSATMEVFSELDLTAAMFTSNVITLTPSQAMASFISMPLSGLTGAATIKYPVCQPGNSVVVVNNSGESVTVMVTGKTGISLATGYQQAFMHSNRLGDIVATSAALAATSGA